MSKENSMGEEKASFSLHKHDIAFRSCGMTILYPKELRMTAKPQEDDYWVVERNTAERDEHYIDRDRLHRDKRKWREGRKAFLGKTLDMCDAGLDQKCLALADIFCPRPDVKWPVLLPSEDVLSEETASKIKAHRQWCRENPYRFELRLDPKAERMMLS